MSIVVVVLAGSVCFPLSPDSHMGCVEAVGFQDDRGGLGGLLARRVI
jgi:hypothetical protein